MQVNTNTPAINSPSRDGFVLVSVLMFVVLMVVLTSAAVFVTRQETKSAMANEQFDRAYRLAERGVADMMVNWRNYNLHTMNEWAAVTDTDTLSHGNWTGTIWKTGPLTFFINTTSEITMGNNLSGATRQVGMMARLKVPTLNVRSALTTQDTVWVNGTSQIVGTDAPPGGWGGRCTGTSDKPGVAMDDSTSASSVGVGDIQGTPPVEEDPSIADSTFTEFGDDTYAELVALATKTVSPGVYSGIKPVLTAGECDITAPLNWGDPTSPADPCGDYFPIIHIPGNATLSGASPMNPSAGQGILLVDGDLNITGRFTFYGIIITQGSFETAGVGNSIVGGVYAANLGGADQLIAGSTTIQYSSCSVQYALERSSSARLMPFGGRSWIDVSAMLW